MPSVGRIKQLSVLGGSVVAALLLSVGTSSASAADVWLWACQGPDGGAVATSKFETFVSNGGQAGDTCGSARLSLANATPGTPSSAEIRVGARGVVVKQVRVLRTTHGFGDAPSQATRNNTA